VQIIFYNEKQPRSALLKLAECTRKMHEPTNETRLYVRYILVPVTGARQYNGQHCPFVTGEVTGSNLSPETILTMITLSRYTHLYLPVLPTFANGCLYLKRDLL